MPKYGEWKLEAERADATEAGFYMELRFDSKEQADKWAAGEENGNKPSRIRTREVTHA